MVSEYISYVVRTRSVGWEHVVCSNSLLQGIDIDNKKSVFHTLCTTANSIVSAKQYSSVHCSKQRSSWSALTASIHESASRNLVPWMRHSLSRFLTAVSLRVRINENNSDAGDSAFLSAHAGNRATCALVCDDIMADRRWGGIQHR